MTTDTTALSYWLNWRFLICAMWILLATIVSAIVIWRFEGKYKAKNRSAGDSWDTERCSSEGDAWGTCLKFIHPMLLLAYRLTAFISMFMLLFADAIIHRGRIFFFYTQWTFALVTVYFGLGSSLSFRGCFHYRKKDLPLSPPHILDHQSQHFLAPAQGEQADVPNITISLNSCDESSLHNSSVWEYALQIIFQMCAGAVALTDSVFWLVLYPFLTAKDFRLNFLEICMHSVNAGFLIGDMILNRLRFPFFRIAYFVLWTCIFVIFQWIFHSFVSIRWPYPFLELSSPYAPIWYISIGLLHLPCFGIFTLIFKTKQCCLSRYNVVLEGSSSSIS